MADWMVGWADGRAEPAALLLIEKAIMPVVMTVTACTFNAVVERAAAVAPCIVQRQCARLCTRAAAARLREGSLARKQMGAMQWACIHRTLVLGCCPQCYAGHHQWAGALKARVQVYFRERFLCSICNLTGAL